MSVDHVETDLRAPKIRPMSAHPLGVLSRPHAKRGVTAETSAHKLRAEGLSYRRIAIELRVRYDQVSRWLSAPPPPPPVVRPAPAPVVSQDNFVVAPRPPTAAMATDQTQNARINDLMATLRQLSRENQERENRLHRIIEAERAAAREQAARRDAELAALRTTVDELAARVASLQADSAPSWRGVWRRGAAR